MFIGFLHVCNSVTAQRRDCSISGHRNPHHQTCEPSAIALLNTAAMLDRRLRILGSHLSSSTTRSAIAEKPRDSVSYLLIM